VESITAGPDRILATFGAAVLTAMLMIGIRKDWTYPAFVDYHFSTYAAQFDQAASGTSVSIPINPGWIMVLHKR
jgi:hypothetical protein